MTITRAQVIDSAKSWIGTPYHHQSSFKGIGCDCLGIVRGVWRELYGYDAEIPPPYSVDWSEGSGRETLLEAARRYLAEIEPCVAQGGDIVVFRLREGSIAKHAAILTSPAKMIHAVENTVVSEVHLGRWWRRHIAAAFTFPGVE